MNINKKGFTLAELLTVVAVLAIVVMISIPLITGRIENARAATCKTNRQALINGTTTASMTDKVDWTGGFSTGSKDLIVTYLIEQGYITEAPYCPSNGQIYVNGVTKDTIYFNCTFHDDGVDPGEESPTVLLDKSREELESAVNNAWDTSGTTLWKSNDNIIKTYIAKGDTSKMCLVDLRSVLTDKRKREIAQLLVEAGTFDSVDVVIKLLDGLLDSEVRLLPYYADATQIVMTYVTNQKAYEELAAGEGTHKPTYFLCYKDKWYLYIKRGVNGKFANTYMEQFRTASLEQVEKLLNGEETHSDGYWHKL